MISLHGSSKIINKCIYTYTHTFYFYDGSTKSDWNHKIYILNCFKPFTSLECKIHHYSFWFWLYTGNTVLETEEPRMFYIGGLKNFNRIIMKLYLYLRLRKRNVNEPFLKFFIKRYMELESVLILIVWEYFDFYHAIILVSQ